MADSQNHGSNIMTDDILLFNILPRLPAKSAGRYMCVSRQFHSFLTSPVFKKLQIHHQNRNHHQKILVLSTTTPYKFCTIDFETPQYGSLTASRPFPFEVGSRIHMTSIVASLHGLVCIKRSRFINEVEYTDLILWNPYTSDYKTLSKPSYDDQDSLYISHRGKFGLYYTCSDDDYNLVCVIPHLQYVYIYSLKSDSWRKVKLESTKCTTLCFLKHSILLNEKLYFLQEKWINGEQHSSYFILRFDPKTETLREIATHNFKETTQCMGFMVVSGFIHLCVGFTDYEGDACHTIELWRMDDEDGDGDGNWTKVVTHSPIGLRISWHEKLLNIMRNGDWVMYRNNYVYQRDMKKDTMHMICPVQDMDINQGWKYTETLVSPNQYTK